MAYYGYHRISTKEQHLDRGIIEIKRFCENQKIKLESIFTDKITGKNFDRPRYTVLVEEVLKNSLCLQINYSGKMSIFFPSNLYPTPLTVLI